MKAFLRPWLLATLIGAGLPLVAQADVWGYVDDQGMTHFAESQLDSRYKLYFKNENFDFDPRKSALAQKQQRRPITQATEPSPAPATRFRVTVKRRTTCVP